MPFFLLFDLSPVATFISSFSPCSSHRQRVLSCVSHVTFCHALISPFLLRLLLYNISVL
jgi:hypothetical protein